VTLINRKLLQRHFTKSIQSYSCLGGVAVRRRTRDRKVAGSTPGGALSSQLGQLSLPSIRSIGKRLIYEHLIVGQLNADS